MQLRVAITCAVTGNQATLEQNPRLPITPERIAEPASEPRLALIRFE